jgi:hypothetical protein
LADEVQRARSSTDQVSQVVSVSLDDSLTLTNRWRLFLPTKWADASAPDRRGKMDPNLALAHITHNTAVIQLHQSIAYPSPGWKALPVSLPTIESGQTCVDAATKISSIARKFLDDSSGIINPQFSFCLFIAGRALLGKNALLPTLTLSWTQQHLPGADACLSTCRIQSRLDSSLLPRHCHIIAEHLLPLDRTGARQQRNEEHASIQV